MRVLLIDDEQFYFKMLQKSLREAEYQLEYAKSGGEGLTKIPSFEPELLIVDWMGLRSSNDCVAIRNSAIFPSS